MCEQSLISFQFQDSENREEIKGKIMIYYLTTALWSHRKYENEV